MAMGRALVELDSRRRWELALDDCKRARECQCHGHCTAPRDARHAESSRTSLFTYPAPRSAAAPPAPPGRAARDDPVAVEPAVLDEDLVRVVARHDHAGDEQPGHRRLERLADRAAGSLSPDRSARRPRASSSVFGAKPVITYTNRAADARRRAGPSIVTDARLDRRHAAVPPRARSLPPSCGSRSPAAPTA